MPPNKNWVDSLIEECSHVETPKSWLWYSFLSCVSAAAGNNYFLTTLKGDLIYKPNLYIMLLGESGLGKGFPVNRAKLLVSEAGVTRVIAGRSSIQAIVTELQTTRSKEGKVPITDSRGYIVNGELSTAIIADPDSLTILTDLYDGNFNPEWTNLLKSTGAEKLKNPYITALFGSSPAHFYDSIPQANIEGGYIGRNLIIYEEKRSQDVDLFDSETDSSEDDKFGKILSPKYVPHLEKIAKHKGQLKPNSAASSYYNAWRRRWRSNQTHDKTGFLNRVPDHSLKIAMCLALADWDFTGEITEFHIQDAIERVTSLIYANKRTTAGRGVDPLAVPTKSVLDHLLAAPDCQLSKKQLLWKGYGDYNTFTLDQVLDNLVEMGWVRKVKQGVGSNADWIVKLSGEPLESYKNFLKKKEVR
ncbi:MAG: hypothetical protein ABWY25_07010 [Paenisporosarcina sp.]